MRETRFPLFLNSPTTADRTKKGRENSSRKKKGTQEKQQAENRVQGTLLLLWLSQK